MLWLPIPAYFNVIRTRLACDVSVSDNGEYAQRQSTGTWDVVKQIWMVDGISGLFSGCAASILQSPLFGPLYVPHSVIFCVDTCLVLVLLVSILNGLEIPFIDPFARGMIAVSITAILCYPFDTVSRRIIVASNPESPLKYRSTKDAFDKIVGEKGFWTLFQGFRVHVMTIATEVFLLVVFDEIARRLFQALVSYTWWNIGFLIF